jgi:hypothetical protein
LGFTNTIAGAVNPLGAGSLADGGARSPGMGDDFKWTNVEKHCNTSPEFIDMSMKKSSVPTHKMIGGQRVRMVHGALTHRNGRWSNDFPLNPTIRGMTGLPYQGAADVRSNLGQQAFANRSLGSNAFGVDFPPGWRALG